jgi:hypothetical protein
MKVGTVNQATLYSLETKKLAQQEQIKQQQLKDIRERQRQLEKTRQQDLDKGNIIDQMV